MDKVDHTLQLATFLSELTYNDLPPQVVDQAKKSILNALGCGLGYALHPPAEKAFAMVSSQRACNDATILGRRQRAATEDAILVNGIAMTTADYDDTYLKTVIHPSGTSLAALLSWAETNHVSGQGFLLAFICGVEAQCAVGNAISPAHYHDGWHITGTTGHFGAAAAVAKAMNLPPHQFAAALGHSASLAGGIRAMFGTDTKTLHMGRGAQNGLLSARLAFHDFGSCSRAVESWARLVSSTVTEESLSSLAKGGGYAILENTFKPYPCGIVIHPLIDAAFDAHATFRRESHLAPQPEGIEAIEATVNPQCERLCSVRHPKTGLETIFSLYHGIAVGLLDGQAGPNQFSDPACHDMRTHELRDKIQVHTDSTLADDAAMLKIHFANRKERVFQVEHATGSLARPMTVEQLEQKFLDLSSGILGQERASEVMARCWNLDQIENMGAFVRLLVPP